MSHSHTFHHDDSANFLIIVNNAAGNNEGTGTPLVLGAGPNTFIANASTTSNSLVMISSTPTDYKKIESASFSKPLFGLLSGWNGLTTVAAVETAASVYLTTVTSTFPFPGTYLALVIDPSATITLNGFSSIIFKFNTGIQRNCCDIQKLHKPHFFFLAGTSGLIPSTRSERCSNAIDDCHSSERRNILANSLNEQLSAIVTPYPSSLALSEIRSLSLNCSTKFRIYSVGIFAPNGTYPNSVVTTKSAALLGTASLTVDNKLILHAKSDSKHNIAYPLFSLFVEDTPETEQIQNVSFGPNLFAL